MPGELPAGSTDTSMEVYSSPFGTEVDRPVEVVDGEYIPGHETPDPTSPENITDAQVVTDEPKPLRLHQEQLQPDQPLELHMANMDDAIRQRALIAAERRLEEEAKEGGFLKRSVRKIWKGVYAHEYYRQKYAREAELVMRENGGNQFALEDGVDADRSAHERATAAMIDRLIASQDADGPALNRGENVEEMGASEGEKALQHGMRDIIKKYASGEYDGEQLREERTRLLDQLRDEHPGVLEGAHVVADNMIGVAEQAKAMVEHGRSVDAIVDSIKFYGDQVRAGVRTEAQRNAADRILERLQGSRMGALVNEATLATAVSVAVSVGKLGSRRAAGAALATAAPGVFSGIFAGLRENMRFKQERAQHMRERAEGRVNEEPSARREAMEEARYETRTAAELTEGLNLPEGEQLNTERVQTLIARLSEISARERISDTRNIDLISFSAVEDVEAERLTLALQRAKAMSEVKKWLANASDAERDGILGGGTLEDAMRIQVEAHAVAMSEGMRQVDKTFAAMKRAAVAKAVVKGTLTGLTFGLISQEGMAALSPGLHGQLESLFGKNGNDNESRQTLLRGLFHGNADSAHAAEAHAEAPRFHYEKIDGHNSIKLPDGFRLTHNHLRDPSDHGMTLWQGDKALSTNLHTNEHGFTEASQGRLDKLGFIHHERTAPVEHVRHVVKSTNASEYLRHHRTGTVHVERKLWYDNDTPAPVFDKNELRLWWGGDNGSGVTEGGDYSFNIAQMSPDGSYHTPESANAQELIREGKMRILLSANEKTQSHPFSFKVDSNGNVHIPKDSVAGRSLFDHTDGHTVFKGRYAEAAQVVGHHDGRTQVKLLATYEGKGVNVLHHPVTERVITHRQVTELIPPPEAVPVHTVEPAPFIPIVWRKEMETTKRPDPKSKPDPQRIPPREPGYEGYGYPGSREAEPWKRLDISPRLEADHQASLDQKTELDWYFESKGSKSHEYIEALDRAVDADPVLRDLGPDVRVMVAIPVAAASEGGNIYETLRLYAAQSAEALGHTVITLNLNWRKGADMAAVTETVKAVERARADFPGLKIATIMEEFPAEGVPFGTIIEHTYDTAMRAVWRAGEEAGDYSDVMLVTNDADAEGMQAKYLNGYQEAIERDDESDMFYGFIRWGTETFERHPGFGFIATLMQALELEARREDKGYDQNPATWGPNSGFRMAALAAIGGPDPNYGAGADSDLGNRIWQLRNDNPEGVGTSEGYGPSGGVKKDGRRIGHVVPSAILDSAPDRILGAYANGIPVNQAWGSFSSQNRDALDVDINEDVEKDFDTIRRRIEFQVNSLIGRAAESGNYGWFHDQDLINTTLNKLLPQGVAPEARWRYNDEGKFELTDSGAVWLKEQLLTKPADMARVYAERRKDMLGD